MITENIIYFPHHKYNVATELVKNLKVCDVINYGYIKLRDLDKWLDGKDIAVKMGMLSPTKDGYRELSVVESALKRIKEQDSTSCFEDDDELVPVYIFISNETDNEWREYLMDRGYSITRRNASREGIRINRRDLSICYAERYNIDTKESLSYKEEIVLKKLKEEEKIKQNEERIIKEYEEKNGIGSYLIDLETIKNIISHENKVKTSFINKETLNGYVEKEYTLLYFDGENDNYATFGGLFTIVCIIIAIISIIHLAFEILLGTLLIWGIISIISGVLSYVYINWTYSTWYLITPNGKKTKIKDTIFKKEYIKKDIIKIKISI